MTSEFDFPFPPLAAGEAAPRWTGVDFATDAGAARVLFYGEAQSGWSDSLSHMKEEISGADHPIDLASRGHALQGLADLAGRDCVIMEVGCLSGHMLRDLRRHFPKAQVIGADYLQQMLVELAPTVPDIPLVQFDLKECPFADASIDGMVLLNVLEHIDDDERALRQIARVLKPGGRAVIEVPAGPALYDYYDEYWMHHRRYRLDDLVRRARAAGLTVNSRTHIGVFIYPAFWLVKKLHRWLGPGRAVQTRVIAQNTKTRHSRAMRWAMKMEDRLRRILYYPFGIRCAIVCSKN